MPELCRERGISNAIFYRWRAKYGGVDASMISELEELEVENARLLKLVKLVIGTNLNYRLGMPLLQTGYLV